MAVRTEDLDNAVRKIEDVSEALHRHIGEQTAVNRIVEKNSEDIVDLRLDSERKNGAIQAVSTDIKRVLEILADRNNKILAWINTATPWALVILGLVYFFVVNKGGSP